jgi:hypothetical protein
MQKHVSQERMYRERRLRQERHAYGIPVADASVSTRFLDFLCLITGLTGYLLIRLHAGGRKEANKAPWMAAYMTMYVTTPLPLDVLAALEASSCLASQKYHSGYPDDNLVITWM